MLFGSVQMEGNYECNSHHSSFYYGPMHGGHSHGDFCNSGQNIPRRFLRPVVLLLLAEKPQHGYELMGRIKEFGKGCKSMDPSLLYRLLRYMGRTGLAESTLDDSGSGPARKVYSLTPEGQEVLICGRSTWMRCSNSCRSSRIGTIKSASKGDLSSGYAPFLYK